MQIPTEAAERYESLTDDSKKEFLKRYRRLRREFRTPENSALLAAGIAPADIRKWPPKIRYMLAGRINKYGLVPGTAAWKQAEQTEILNIQAWLTGWWERNHECR